jgi:hypothetical protein
MRLIILNGYTITLGKLQSRSERGGAEKILLLTGMETRSPWLYHLSYQNS